MLEEGQATTGAGSRHTESRQSVNIRLLGGNGVGLHVLHDWIGDGATIGDAQVLGHALGIKQVITPVIGMDMFEKTRIANRDRVYGSHLHLDVVGPVDLENARQREVAVGTAKRPEEVKRKCHGLHRAESAENLPGACRLMSSIAARYYHELRCRKHPVCQFMV